MSGPKPSEELCEAWTARRSLPSLTHHELVLLELVTFPRKSK